MDGLSFEDGKWIIDLDSEVGFLLAVESFIYYCSDHVIPKNCDREQLVQNIEMLRNPEKRELWIRKGWDT